MNEAVSAAATQEILVKLLGFIRDRRLVAPSLIMLELYRPLVGIGDALLICAQPFLKPFSLYGDVLDVLRSRANVDWLIAELAQGSNTQTSKVKN